MSSLYLYYLVLLVLWVPLLWAAPVSAFLTALPEDLAIRYWVRGRVPGDEAGALFPFLVVAVGTLVALGVWYWDHTENHILALSLPVTRRRYVLTKFGAGAALIVPVATAFSLGALVAAAGLELPAWLRAFPGRLGFKFLLATFTVYALIFALAAGTIPTTLKTLTAIAIIAVAIPALPLLVGASAGEVFLRISEVVYRVLYEWPGPFAVLGGDWSLIGV